MALLCSTEHGLRLPDSDKGKERDRMGKRRTGRGLSALSAGGESDSSRIREGWERDMKIESESATEQPCWAVFGE